MKKLFGVLRTNCQILRFILLAQVTSFPFMFWKRCQREIATLATFTQLVNQSFSECAPPQEWRKVSKTPIAKVAYSPSAELKLRPIANTSAHYICLAECTLSHQWSKWSKSPIPKFAYLSLGEIKLRPLGIASALLKPACYPGRSWDLLRMHCNSKRATVDSAAAFGHSIFLSFGFDKRGFGGIFYDLCFALNPISRPYLWHTEE